MMFFDYWFLNLNGYKEIISWFDFNLVVVCIQEIMNNLLVQYIYRWCYEKNFWKSKPSCKLRKSYKWKNCSSLSPPPINNPKTTWEWDKRSETELYSQNPTHSFLNQNHRHDLWNLNLIVLALFLFILIKLIVFIHYLKRKY